VGNIAGKEYRLNSIYALPESFFDDVSQLFDSYDRTRVAFDHMKETSNKLYKVLETLPGDISYSDLSLKTNHQPKERTIRSYFNKLNGGKGNMAPENFINVLNVLLSEHFFPDPAIRARVKIIVIKAYYECRGELDVIQELEEDIKFLHSKTTRDAVINAYDAADEKTNTRTKATDADEKTTKSAGNVEDGSSFLNAIAAIMKQNEEASPVSSNGKLSETEESQLASLLARKMNVR